MKERPIIFSGPMVRAIMEGRKTQTRRVVKLRDRTATYSDFDDDGWPMSMDECGDWHRDPCPYGVPGDRLYCKETFAHGAMGPIFRADWGDPVGNNYPAHPSAVWLSGIQKACGADVLSHEWKSPIHMPRRLSRITLEIESVRVERLQEISEADAMAEGITETFDSPGGCHERTTASEHFRYLWESIHGTDKWALNPWVWVLSFKKV